MIRFFDPGKGYKRIKSKVDKKIQTKINNILTVFLAINNPTSQSFEKLHDSLKPYIKYIQKQMGHSKPSVTMDISAHLMDEENPEAAKKLDDTIFQTGSKMVAEG